MRDQESRISAIVDEEQKTLVKAAAGLWAAQHGKELSEAAYLRAIVLEDAQRRISAMKAVLGEQS